MTEELQKLLDNAGQVVELDVDDLYSFDENFLSIYLKKLINLHSLDLREYNYKYKSAWEVENLTCLICHTINEKDFNDNILKLRNLESLVITHNDFTSFPLKILELPKLKYLYLAKNKFSNFEYFFDYNGVNFIDVLEQNRNLFKEIKTYSWGCIIKDIADVYFLNRFNDFEVGVFTNKGISVDIAGDYNKPLQLLNKIKEIAYSSKELKIINEFFYYKKDANWSESDLVDVNKLKLYKKRNRRYYDEWLVDDLLEYVGGKEYRVQLEIQFALEKFNEQKNYETQGNSKYITDLTFRDFKLFSEIQIKLQQHVNVVIGKNGTGKTTLLQAIAMSSVFNLSPELPKNLQNYIRKTESFANNTVFWGQFERNIKIYPNGIETIQSFIPTPFVFAYGANIFHNPTKISADLLDNLKIGNGSTTRISTLFEDYSDNFNDPTEVLSKLKFIYNVDEISLNYLKETINEFLKITEIEEFTINGNSQIVDKNGKQWKLPELSEGYRNNLLLVSDLVFSIFAARNQIFSQEIPINQTFEKAAGLVLIDEFDRHLHPTWQRGFVGKLTKVFPNVQFVLTTHNILSVQSAVGGNAIMLSVNGVEQKKIDYGWSIERIYNEFLEGDNKIYDHIVQGKLHRFSELIDSIYKEQNTDLINSEFKEIVKYLLFDIKSSEVNSMVAHEIAQLEEIIGKTIEL